MRRLTRLAGLVAGLIVLTRPGTAAALHAQQAAELRWGGDAEGGAPYVEADPSHPDRVVGFDVEVAELLAHDLGRTPRFIQITFTSLDQSARRGDFEIGLSGIEDTPARRASVAATIPYYEFREVLTVRDADRDRFRSLADLKGHRVGTLSGTIAYELLLAAARDQGLAPPVAYDDDVHPYGDLANGRIDAVLLDNVLANRSMRKVAGLYTEPGAVAIGHYIGVLAPANAPLRDRIDDILRGAMRDGRLEAIFRKWNVWNDDQPKLFANVLAHAAVTATVIPGTTPLSPFAMTVRYLPTLLLAALKTLVLSCLSMALAIAFGMGLAIGRVYGRGPVRVVVTTYVEVMRGTPVLLQLFVLYYGLASVVRLDPWVAAIVGLGLNYAAYESEIYRSALEAIPRGQLDAARVLGFTSRQTLRLIRGPQAFRLALAPMTNDFVAMLKDSSLVSVLTVPELTKQTQIFATNLGSWVIPGVLCAGLYLAMSLPIAHVARRLEAKWKAASRA
jgi:polar amino acid transport system substrate-binding protein